MLVKIINNNCLLDKLHDKLSLSLAAIACPNRNSHNCLI